MVLFILSFFHVIQASPLMLRLTQFLNFWTFDTRIYQFTFPLKSHFSIFLYKDQYFIFLIYGIILKYQSMTCMKQEESLQQPHLHPQLQPVEKLQQVHRQIDILIDKQLCSAGRQIGVTSTTPSTNLYPQQLLVEKQQQVDRQIGDTTPSTPTTTTSRETTAGRQIDRYYVRQTREKDRQINKRLRLTKK